MELLLWSKNGTIQHNINNGNADNELTCKAKSRYLQGSNEIIFVVHDFGETGSDPQIRRTVMEKYKRHPNARVISLDWSHEVSNMLITSHSAVGKITTVRHRACFSVL